MTLVEKLSARPPTQRRVLAVVMLVAAIGLIWGAIIVPLVWVVGSQDEWRTDARRDLARALGRAASEPVLRKRAAALAAEPIWGKFYDVPQGQDATALVQRDVMSVGTDAGVKIQAVVPVPRVEEAGLVGFGIRFTTTLSADQLKKFMVALRGNAGYLRVERLTVNAPQVQRADQNALLTVTMEVYGFSRDRSAAPS
jgi:hypothetical protein